jgi:hypothetical protein
MMNTKKQPIRIRRSWFWIGFLSLIWVLLRTGTNPKRITYPCQRAATPIATSWLLAVTALLAGNLLLRRFAKMTAGVGLIVGVAWLIGALPENPRAMIALPGPLPVWEVEDPVSTIFVMDAIPPTPGSLAAGDATVPDEHLPDPAIDTLLAMMQTKDIYLHQTAAHPAGIVGADNIVILKGNFQWTSRNTTSTDRIKGMIWQILQHPDGFSGEIIICDNTQDIGTGINHLDNNSEDPSHSLIDVVDTFVAKGYPVYCFDWASFWAVVALEYSTGDYRDGFVYEADTKISYPKFSSPSGDYYVSLRHGVWDSVRAEYDPSRLCIIDFPVLKAHSMAGATIAVKNWIGTLTTAHSSSRYGGWNNMHYQYFFGSYALVARVMAETYPRLTIVDAAWTSTRDPNNLGWLADTNMLLGSTDPTAVSWYAAKYILTPIALVPSNTDPDRAGSAYRYNLESWTSYLQSEGFSCTKDPSEISVYDRRVLDPTTPVHVEDLRATVSDPTAVHLSWRLRHAGDGLLGLDVERADAARGSYTRRTRAQLAPEAWMDYVDAPVETDKSYWYRLVLTYTSGTVGLVGPIRVDVPGTVHSTTTLLAPFVPPGGGDVEVRYRIGDAPVPVDLHVYDVRGRLLKTLDRGVRGPGEYVQLWDRRDATGTRLARGVYLVRLSAGAVTVTQRLVLALE